MSRYAATCSSAAVIGSSVHLSSAITHVSDLTRQLLRNVLWIGNVRQGGPPSTRPSPWSRPGRRSLGHAAVEPVQAQRGRMTTDVRFGGHGALAHAASQIAELRDWA